MSNTRVTYSDLNVGFTLGTNTDPSTTDAADYITDLYKAAYDAMYGNQDLYHATDDNIDSKLYNTINNVVKRAVTRIIRKITDYYTPGSSVEYPPIELNDDEKFALHCAFGVDIYLPSHEDDDLTTVGDDR